MEMKSPIKVIVVDDQLLIREGLIGLFKKRDDMEIIYSTGSPFDALEILKRKTPDVMLIDIEMHEMNGMILAEKILKVYKNIRIIFLSSHDDLKYVRNAFKIGVSGYLLKAYSFKEIIEAINSALRGENYFSKRILEVANGDYSKFLSGNTQKPVSLTLREKEVLQLTFEEKMSKDISDILNISPKTVEFHRSNIMKKLQINSIPELTKYAIRVGITTL